MVGPDVNKKFRIFEIAKASGSDTLRIGELRPAHIDIIRLQQYW